WQCGLRNGASTPPTSSPGPSGEEPIKPPQKKPTSNKERNC
ncbi:MAG: hypothetical protein AVDCRST_MAG26-3795, partial [uncultured Chloroflexia bacterium]